MKLKSYLWDKLVFIFITLVTAGFSAELAHVVGLGGYAAGFIAGLLILGQAAALAYEFMKKRDFYNALMQNLEKLDKKYLLFEMLDEPSFYEAEIFCEAIKVTNKAMNDEIAKYRLASQEYREYIETWVHEVKTPISSSKLIIENNRNSVTLNINEELYKIENYVDQALFYSRSNTVEKDYLIKQTTLKELVNSALKKHAKLFIESRISVEASELDKTVFTDVKWTDFILGQILINAVKYRSAEPKIRIYSIKNENSVTLMISDNGIGISEADLGRVFEKGFTGTNGRASSKSTGIGLYLCKKLCDKLNLGLNLVSETGKGTTLSIVFPKSNMFE